MKKISITWVAIAVYLLFPVNLVTSYDLGSLDSSYYGQGDARFSGAYTLAFPIDTPKGVAGSGPNLSVSYNSQNTSTGTLGTGFSLSGISKILPDPSVLGSYTLDGQRLIVGSDKNFHTVPESYDLIQVFNQDTGQQVSDPRSGRCYWVIKKKDGSTLIYGNSDQSRGLWAPFKLGSDTVPGNTVASGWPICEATDSLGNQTVFSYIIVKVIYLSTGKVYPNVLPKSVEYSKNPLPGNGVTKWNLVKFGYDYLMDVDFPQIPRHLIDSGV